MRWTIKPKPSQETINQLSNELKVDPLVAHLLVQRGITNYEEAKHFFRPQLDHLHDPFLMKDMNKAVERIEQAISAGENILVYGDYDVDGTTSVALMSSFLQETYPNVATYIPDRYAEGYGVSLKGIDYAADNDISLIIALDCGVKAVKQVNYAKEKGIDFIICDHHRPGNILPNAIAVLDPKQEDCPYPYKELCGCGVGFKLIQALVLKNGRAIASLVPYLDLVATAIAADIVPITGENRVLTHFGLQVINTNPRLGIKAITAQLKKKTLTVSDVVFVIAPRINAAGRMKHGEHAVNLLTETDWTTAQQFCKDIEAYNTERKSLDKEITQEALLQIETNEEQERFTSVVYDESWHKGVIGIVASRLTETHYRPTLVFTKSGDTLAASARSVKGFDIYNALGECSSHLLQFGGHKYAAGLTMQEEQYEAFKQQFEEVVAKTISPNLLQPEIEIDLKVNLEQITPKLMRILKQFEPFGPGNMTPIFMAEGIQDTGSGKTVGEDGKHLKISARQNGAAPIGAIGFGLGHKLEAVQNKKPFDAVFSLDENEWNGMVNLQLKLRDIR
ncbi:MULTISPECIES: single-stranded-DNA-specific exonuclease RecJ [Flavobacteriaceae]|uniref:single-stranded-DNA-specific exonuclease RecJ n=1 Tax=Flavobacteriaceae TaxID=49546 RepID=UPI001491F810|nr:MULTISPECIES: single-stranded-DNA-specific exonuclease RecJ [Allomuricauda]MDC6365220.1 single-stranded-DNA-specific exonuclease RecJ [Muricauda sp. AC10]